MVRQVRARGPLLLVALMTVFCVVAAAVSVPSLGGSTVSAQLPLDAAAKGAWPAEIATLCSPPLHRVSLPAVFRQAQTGVQLQPTLGPSPTPTRTPAATLGPSPTPTHTPGATATVTPTPGGPTTTPGPTLGPTFDVAKVVWPESGNIGTVFVFTIGLINPLDVPVQVSLVDALPAGLVLGPVWAPTGTVVQRHDDTFTLTLTVPHNWTDNVFFCAVAEVPPCSYSCYVQNNARWVASWPGGSGSGTASSQKILLVNTTPTPTPATPTLTPPIVPTWPTATPGTVTPGPSQTATPTAIPTVPPPTPSRTPQPTLGPSPTPSQ